MALFLNSVQCFAIGIFLFGIFGFLQGWRHSLVVMGFTLAAVLFLFIGGANGIAQFLFVRLPEVVNVITGGAIGPKTLPPPNPTEVLISEIATIGLAIFLGIIVGNRAFPSKPGTISTKDHFLGIIPGLVTGYAVISYASHIFAGNPNIAVGLIAPSTSSLGGYITILVIIAVIALVIGLLTARFGK